MFGSTPLTCVRFEPTVVAVMVRSRGSRMTVPRAPCGAEVSARPVRRKPASPESSTVPPLPEARPPRALTVPPTDVDCVLSTVTRPPWPAPVASADTRAPVATSVRAEVPVGAGPLPVARASVVPSATVPPPAWPLAEMRAVGATTVARLPATVTVPPMVPATRPAAATCPSMTTEPPVPVISIRPAWPPAVSAWTLPPARTRFCTTPSAARAVSTMVPPSAAIVPVLVTSAVTILPSGPTGAWRTCFVTSMETSPSPYMSMVCAAAPASTTWPMRAVMTPELATDGATNAASPASFTVMAPWFSIRASGRAAWSNTMRPAMKFWVEMPAALTTTLWALTWEPWWKTTPEGFTSTSCPFALMRPAMAEGSGPVTRLSVTEALLGCWKVTDWLRPTSNERQSMAARLLDWLIVVDVGALLMAAVPATTWPPCGRAFGAGCAAAGRTGIAPGTAKARPTTACSAVLRNRCRRFTRSWTGFAAVRDILAISRLSPIPCRARYRVRIASAAANKQHPP